MKISNVFKAALIAAPLLIIGAKHSGITDALVERFDPIENGGVLYPGDPGYPADLMPGTE